MIVADSAGRNSDTQLKKYAIEKREKSDIHEDLATQSKVIPGLTEQGQEEHILYNRRNTSESSPDSEQIMDGSPMSAPELDSYTSKINKGKDFDSKCEMAAESEISDTKQLASICDSKCEMAAESEISDTKQLASICKIKQGLHSPENYLPGTKYSVIDEESEKRDIVNSLNVDAQNVEISVPNGKEYEICDDINAGERMDIESPGLSNTSGDVVAAFKQESNRELLREKDDGTKTAFPDDPYELPVGDFQRTGKTKQSTATNQKKKMKRNLDGDVLKLNQLVREIRKQKKEAMHVKRGNKVDEREQIQGKADMSNNITLYSGLDCTELHEVRFTSINVDGLSLPTDNTSTETEQVSAESCNVLHKADSINTCQEMPSTSDPNEPKIEKIKLKILKKGVLGRQVSIISSASDSNHGLAAQSTPENLPSTDVLPDALTESSTIESSRNPTDLAKKPRKRKLKDKELNNSPEAIKSKKPNNSSETTETKKPKNSSETTKTKKPKKSSKTPKSKEPNHSSETTKAKKRKQIIKRIERKREHFKQLREAKLAKREEKQRRKRVKERQKELDERYQMNKENDEDLDEAEKDGDDITESVVSETPSIPVLKRYVLEEVSELNAVVEIDPVLLAKLKPHQVEAVRFMYDCCIESIARRFDSDGGGCILAHCMGLGKTLSVISFIYSLMSNKDLTSIRSCLIVCPLNTVKNWANEFDKWLSDLPFKIDVHEMSNIKDNKTRREILTKWRDEHGVMILGYEMYRSLVLEGRGKVRVQRETYADILANPGPDLVICDEGHILKNSKSLMYKAMKRIRTGRRVILTGTPLQNNLKEYYHMVNYVKPLLLSTMKDFQMRFIDPITAGQCKDSSPTQMKTMKDRVHVLHKILGGCVQRKDYSALTKFLQPKHEYVISVRLGQKQCFLYEKYLRQTGVDGVRKVHGRDARLFKDYQALMKIWTHPWLLTQESNKKESKKNKSKTQLKAIFANIRGLEQSPYTDTDTNSILCLTDRKSNKDEIEAEMDISSDGPIYNNTHLSYDIAVPSEGREDSQHSHKFGEISDKGHSTPTSLNNGDMPTLEIEDDTVHNEENLSTVGECTQMCFEKIENLSCENTNLSPSNDTDESNLMPVDDTDPISLKESVSPAPPELRNILSDIGEKTHISTDYAATPSSSIVASDDEEMEDKDQMVLCNADMFNASAETSRMELDNWWKEHVCEADGCDMTLGGKIMLLFEILDMCRNCGDKLLVFSQSIPSLNLIERFLKIKNESVTNKTGNEKSRYPWVKDKHFFRIDGTTNAQKRKDLQKTFNDHTNKSACLFLISTKAGSLGTNLVAANRVIIFDASWNPSHDIQSIFRAYRFGQVKPVYVYRFLAQGTMEEKIYERQVTKQSLSKRVIDEHQIERHFTQADLQALYEFKPDRLDDDDRQNRPLPVLPKDELLANLMTSQKDLIVTFHEHDSLLENIEEQELTEDEKKVAWEDYERKALHIFRPMAPNSPEYYEENVRPMAPNSPEYYEENGRPMAPNSPEYYEENDSNLDHLNPSAGLMQLSNIAETADRMDIGEWLQQPDRNELLSSIEDLIQEKCPEVLMVGDGHNIESNYMPTDYSQAHVSPFTYRNPGVVVDVDRSCEEDMNVPIQITEYQSISGNKSTVKMDESQGQAVTSVGHFSTSVHRTYSQGQTVTSVDPFATSVHPTYSQGQTVTSANHFSTSGHPTYIQEVQESCSLVVPEMPMNQSNSNYFVPILSNTNERDLNTPDLELREYREPDNTSMNGIPTRYTSVNQRNDGSPHSGVHMKPKQKMMERLRLDNQQKSPSPLDDAISFETESPTPDHGQLVPLNLSVRDSPMSTISPKHEIDLTIQENSERINDDLDVFKNLVFKLNDTSSAAPRLNENVQTNFSNSHSVMDNRSPHRNQIIPASISDETIQAEPEELDAISTDTDSSPGTPELVIDMSVDTNEHSINELEQRIPLTVLQNIDTRQLSVSPEPVSTHRPYSPLMSGGYEDISDTDSD